MKFRRTKAGNISIILETDQELYYLYSVSNVAAYDVRLNAEQLDVNVDEGDSTCIMVGVDLFYGLRKFVDVP